MSGRCFVQSGTSILGLGGIIPGIHLVAAEGAGGGVAALGFFAAVPIAYLVLVVAVQVIRPLLG